MLTLPFPSLPCALAALQSAAGAASSVTGVKAVLAAQGVMVSTQEIADGELKLYLECFRGAPGSWLEVLVV